MHLYNFGGSGSNPTTLCHVTCRYVRVLTRVQLLQDAATLKFWRANNVEKFGVI